MKKKDKKEQEQAKNEQGQNNSRMKQGIFSACLTMSFVMHT